MVSAVKGMICTKLSSKYGWPPSEILQNVKLNSVRGAKGTSTLLRWSWGQREDVTLQTVENTFIIIDLTLRGRIWEIRLVVRFGDRSAGLGRLRTTMVRVFNLSLLRKDIIQGAKHFSPTSTIHTLGTSNIVCRSRTPVNFAEMLLVLNVVAINIHGVCTFHLNEE